MVVLGGSLAAGIAASQTAALPVLVIALALVAVRIGQTSVGVQLANGLPFAVLIGMQTFRLVLELVMHRTCEHGVLPLGKGGYTVDALFGLLSAALVLRVVFGGEAAQLIRAWNWLGIASLLNIAVISGQNPWVGITVFVWIPTLLLPFGVLGHVLVFQRLRNERTSDQALLEPPRMGTLVEPWTQAREEQQT